VAIADKIRHNIVSDKQELCLFNRRSCLNWVAFLCNWQLSESASQSGFPTGEAATGTR
jgi:hypothetical protein